MDDDDIAKPHQIETLIRVAKNTKADVVTSGHDVFVGDVSSPSSSIERFIPLGDASMVGMLENVFGDASMLVEKNFFVQFGGFTEDYGVGFEDYEFLAKVALSGHRLEAVSESLLWYRKHEDTMSSHTNLKSNQIRFLRAYVEKYPMASKHAQALLRFTQQKFFERGNHRCRLKRILASNSHLHARWDNAICSRAAEYVRSNYHDVPFQDPSGHRGRV
jgi:GT2 family glycosyltransferase